MNIYSFLVMPHNSPDNKLTNETCYYSQGIIVMCEVYTWMNISYWQWCICSNCVNCFQSASINKHSLIHICLLRKFKVWVKVIGQTLKIEFKFQTFMHNAKCKSASNRQQYHFQYLYFTSREAFVFIFVFSFRVLAAECFQITFQPPISWTPFTNMY